MHYTFPKIVRLQDVEQYIDDSFRVTEQSSVTFINYNLSNQDTFPPVVTYGDAVRREFRGIAFDTEGGFIVSRPFHKFFNLDERPDEQPDWSVGYTSMEKLDGSMIRPIRYPSGSIRWCTKAGITGVAQQAEVFVARNPRYERFAKQMLDRGLTPIFEYVGPDNKIVLNYEEENLVLLAIRNMVTGHYVNLDQPVVNYLALDIPVVKEASLRSVSEVKDAVDEEGIVISFFDGHKVKVKSEWYVTRHKGKELLSNERKVVQMVLDETLDDMLPFVSQDQADELRKFADELDEVLLVVSNNLSNVRKVILSNYESRKDFALSPLCSRMVPWEKAGVFKAWDDKDFYDYDYIVDTLRKNLSTRDKYSRIKEEFGIPDLNS